MKAPIAAPVPLKASRTAGPSSGAGVPCAKRASGVGTGEKVLVSCFSWAMTRRIARLLGIADEIALGELDAVVAQDAVGGGDVAIEIRQRKAEQVLHPLPLHFARTQLDGQVLLLAAVDLRRLERLDEGHRLRDARLELGGRLLGILVLRHLDARQPRHRALRRVAGDLHLAREREHVRIEPASGQHQRVDFFCFGVRLHLVENAGKVVQGVDEARRARLVHRNCHRKTFWSGFLPAFILSHRGGSAMGRFVIAPHFRLQEWVAEEKGYFKAEGLDYAFSDSWGKDDPGKTHQVANKFGAYQTFEKGREQGVSCACHWTVNAAASHGHGKLYADCYSVAPSAVFVPPESAVKTPQDLKGVPISVGYQSGSHYSTLQALEQYLKPNEIRLSFADGILFGRLQKLVDREVPAAALFSGPYYFAEQLGFRKIIDTTFMITSMISG